VVDNVLRMTARMHACCAMPQSLVLWRCYSPYPGDDAVKVAGWRLKTGAGTVVDVLTERLVHRAVAGADDGVARAQSCTLKTIVMAVTQRVP
jgi:hypothetical protein